MLNIFIRGLNYRINKNNIAFYTPIKKAKMESKLVYVYGIIFIFHTPLNNSKEEKIYYQSEELRDKKIDELDELYKVTKI